MKNVVLTLLLFAFVSPWTSTGFASVEPLVKEIFEDLLTGFPTIEGSVLRDRGDRFQISIGRSQGVTCGMIFRVLRDRGKLKDPETGEVMGRDLQPSGWLRVTRLFDKTAEVEVLEGRASRGDRVTTALVVWPIEISSILLENEKDTPLGQAIRDLLKEKMEQSGRFVLKGSETPTLADHTHRLDCAYRLEGELLDTTGALGITLKLLRMPEGRIVRLLTRQVPMTASLRRLVGSSLHSPTPYVSVAHVALDRRNVCDLAAVPLPGRQWVALLSGNGIDMIRFKGERLELLPGLQFSQSLEGTTGMGQLLAREDEKDGIHVLFRTVGPKMEELRLSLSGHGFLFRFSEEFPLLWMNDAPLEGSLVEGRNFFSKELGVVGAPKDFVDIARGAVLGSDQALFCVVGADDMLYVLDDKGSLLWRGNQPCGARIAACDWDGNGIAEIACTSASPLGTVDELRLLEWNGEIFWEKWRSGTIQGSIMGIAGADLDGDGRDELVVATEELTASGETCRLQVFRATGALGTAWD